MVDFKKIYHYSKDLHVLYVEDNAEVRASTLDILNVYFPMIDTAVDGLDGLEKYKTFYADNARYYDLVISDINMPRFNGIEMSKAVFEMNDEQMLIILSAYNESEYLLELINLGVSYFMLKPMKIDQFSKILYRVVQTIGSRKAEIERRKHEEEERGFLQSVMDLQDNFIVITDGKEIETANRSMLDFFDFKRLETFKKVHHCICDRFVRDDDYFHLGLLEEDTLWIEHILHNPEKDFTVMMQNAKTLGYELFKVSVNYFRSKKRYIATFSNITKMALLNKTHKHKATYDSLTGIYNRHILYDLLERYPTPEVEIERPHIALVMFDIDHFKEVNDKYGHMAGDEVLKQMVSIIKQNIRENDIFARWGGEEFVLVFEGLTLENALKATEHIRQDVEEALFEKVGHLTCSFGISLYREGDTMNELISRADQAMYDAKKSGRNKICHS